MKFETVKKGSKGTSVIVLQSILRCMMFVGKNGKPLVIDGECGDNLIYAINQFQEQQRAYGFECGTNGKNDSTFGSKSWNRLLGV